VPQSLVRRVGDALAAAKGGAPVARDGVDACAGEVYKIMETDALPRFQKWPPYVDFLARGAAPAAPSREDSLGEWARLLDAADPENANLADFADFVENPLKRASVRLAEMRTTPAGRDARRASAWTRGAGTGTGGGRPSSPTNAQ